jgi:outer membrane lipoprotein-sorting protein
MFKRNIAVFSAALALIGVTMTPAGAQTQPKNGKQRGATDQMLAQLNEPENYRATMVVHIIPIGGARNINIPPLRFNVAKMGADRRWSFQLPQIGEVIYLEDGAQKYLILPSRNQYVEIDPSQLSVPLPWAVNPASVVENIKRQANFERVGTTVINGRRATAYRAAGVTRTDTSGGRLKNETKVYVGERTGLPLRVEMDNMTSSGAGARVIIETESIDTSPTASLFNVPTGMNKVSSEQLKRRSTASSTR